MNFFEHQARARRQTRRLVVLLALAVIAMIAAIDGALLFLLASGRPEGVSLAETARQFSGVLLAVALGVLAVIVLASLFKSAALRSGGGAVVRQLGGTPVGQDTTQPRLRRLRNVVEEIAIASGIAVPEIYVLEQEAGINAFAAGWSPADAAIAVTRGALEKLSRDELQGVIAHEFSHVLNGDMRLNIRLMGLLFGILVVALVGRAVFRASSRSRASSRKNGGGIVLLALAVMAVGYIGLFFGRLIKAGVSRSREFLADSSAVQFTRQTSGIAGALKKLAGINSGSRLVTSQAEDVSHMLFGDGVGYSALFATHPPLAERIRRLDPAFKPEQIRQAAAAWNASDYRADDPADDAPQASHFAALQTPVEPALVAQQVAKPSGDDYLYAGAVHAAIAPALRRVAGEEPRALVFALLLDADETIRQGQLSLIGERAGLRLREQALGVLPAALRTPAAQRLPLAALAFPALRQLPGQDLTQFLSTVTLLMQADGRLGLFEFCLGSLMRAQLADLLNPSQAQVLGRRRLGTCKDAAVTLLSALAQVGSPETQQSQRAFAAGLQHLPGFAAIRYAPVAELPDALERAFAELDELDAPGKQMLIEALAATLNHDRRVTVGEAELLRAVCGRLHCPLPPCAQWPQGTAQTRNGCEQVFV